MALCWDGSIAKSRRKRQPRVRAGLQGHDSSENYVIFGERLARCTR